MSGAAVAKPDRGQKPLPQGWRWVRLADVIREAQPGFASGLRDPNGVLQLRMNNVGTRGNLVWDELLRVPLEGRSLADCTLAPGDVVFNNTNSTELVGKSARFEGYPEAVVYSNHFTRLRVAVEALDPGYLANWLLSQWQAGVFRGLCNRWIGQSAVKNDRLLSLEIPLPSLAEQRRIAARLREHMASLGQARAAAEAQLEAAKAVSAAYLRQVFEGPEARRWPKKRLGDICEIQLGKMLSPKARGGYRPRRYLRNANVQWNRFDLSDVAEMDFSHREEEKFALRAGDLIVCEGGEPGRAAVWQGSIETCYYQKALHRLRPLENSADPWFIMYRLWFGAIRREFVESNARTTIAHLPAVRLSQLPISLPPPAQQRAIVEVLSGQIAGANRLVAALESRSESINGLRNALLRQAFRGEL